MSDIRPYGPGKFNTILDAAVFNLSQCGTDEELADEGFGWAGLLRLAPGETLVQPEHFAPIQLNPAEEEFLAAQTAGCILREGTDGSVAVSYFSCMEGLTEAWGDVEKAYEPFAADDETMNPGPS